MAEFCEHSAQSWSILDDEGMMYCDDCESIIVRAPTGEGWRPIGRKPEPRTPAPRSIYDRLRKPEV